MKLTLDKTCSMCPEQYDVLLDGERVGYLRLRYGHFTVECPDAWDHLVYEASVGYGEFPDEPTRRLHLARALKAIRKWYRSREHE